MTLRILVVDDDAMLRVAMCAKFEAELGDAEVVTANDATSAERVLASQSIDLVVTDVAMERADAGWDLAAHARRRGVPVLLVTGRKGSAELGRALAVPLMTKSELARTSLGGIVRSAIACQQGRVENA